MRDIGNRLKRYRLSRYAAPSDPVRRRLRWFWFVALAWLAYVGLLSDHSFYRLWRLKQERVRTATELSRTRAEIEALEKDRKDPAAQRERTERQLRRTGMAREGEIIYRIRDSGADSTR
jgi:cell division protein FtsB